MAQTSWIAVDWGTSNLRAWVFDRDGQEIGRFSSDRGMSVLKPDEFEPTLLELAGDYLPPDQVTPVIACGMVGANLGWTPAPYAAVPCPPPGVDRAARPAPNDPRLDVRILPGVSQADPADVMRGEETQIAGFLSQKPDFEGVICLPGTHTKWARIAGGEITGFATFMSGEIFALLSEKSVLRHTVSGMEWDDDSFATAVTDAMDAPEALTARLFCLRAKDLLRDTMAGEARARLSGLLIGAELLGARPYWSGQKVVILGETRLGLLYQAALATQGVTAPVGDVTEMTKAGLSLAYNAWKGGHR